MHSLKTEKRVTAFEELEAFKKEHEVVFEKIGAERVGVCERVSYLEGLLRVYAEYEPYIKNHKEQWELKGWECKKYERKHMVEQAYYDTHRNKHKSRIVRVCLRTKAAGERFVRTD